MSIAVEVSSKKGFPKWDGLIDLREAGLRVPKAVFSMPNSTERQIHELVINFMHEMNSDLLALRPDGGNGFGKTPPGISLKKTEVDSVIKKIYEWNSQRLGVVLLDTHDRFDYEFCCNCLLDDDGSFHLEFVGPGFDGGDLNKSILSSTLDIQSKFGSSILDYSDPISGEANIESLEALLLRITVDSRAPTDEEINTRLKYIASQLLPDMGIQIEKTAEAAKRWLIENNYKKLIETRHSKKLISADELKEIVLSVSRYAHQLKKKGQKLKAEVLTAHKYDGKIVFFGTYNGHKWGN